MRKARKGRENDWRPRGYIGLGNFHCYQECNLCGDDRRVSVWCSSEPVFICEDCECDYKVEDCAELLGEELEPANPEQVIVWRDGPKTNGTLRSMRVEQPTFGFDD